MNRLTALFLCLIPFWLTACGDDSEGEPDRLTVEPQVPLNLAVGVPTTTPVVVEFNTDLNKVTLDEDSFTLTQGGNPRVASVVSFDAVSKLATLTPNAPLLPGLVYEATVLSTVRGGTGQLQMQGDYKWSFTTADAPLSVSSVVPANGSAGVPIRDSLSITFSEAMDPATLDASTFTLQHGVTQVAGAVSVDDTNRRATFTPDAPLGPGLLYAAIVTTGALSSAAHLGLAEPYSWVFVTAATSPTVAATVPVAAATNVGLAGPISAIFSEEMASATFDATTFVLTEAGVSIAGAVSYVSASKTATFIPSAPLHVDAVHTATIKSSVTSSGGTPLGADSIWTFRTLDGKPTVLASSPLSTAPYISINDKLRASFSAPMNAATLTSATFSVAQGATPVAGSVLYVPETNTAIFTPSVALTPGQPYTARISAAAADLNGRTLAPGFSWTFTTTPCGMLPVALGVAASFAALAGGGVSDTASSSVFGNVGVSPGSEITGFLDGSIIGSREANTQAAVNAQAAFGLAYADALGRDAGCAATLTPQLGGQTLTPGLYKSALTLSNTGSLTLDAQGDADAVFIFQAGGLNALQGSQVLLVGGARAANVFWQLNASASLSGDFVGTVMAMASVELHLGVVLQGRALARNGLVALDGCDLSLLDL
jgi:hypothetical protein